MNQKELGAEDDQPKAEGREGVAHSLHGDPSGRVFHSVEAFFDYLDRDREPTEDVPDR